MDDKCDNHSCTRCSGIPDLRQKYNWRQHTPAAQLAVLYQSINGQHSNWLDGITEPQDALFAMTDTLLQLEELLPFISQGHW